MDVDNRQAYEGSGKLVRADLVGRVSYDLYPVEFVSMSSCHRTQLGALARTMKHKNRDVQRSWGETLTRAKEESA
jgi:hypothetical protein